MNWSLYSIIQKMVGDGSAMIYGPTGSGKSIFTRCLVQSAVNHKVNVAVLDTEGNFTDDDIFWFKATCAYDFKVTLKDVLLWVKNLKQGFKLVVIDSIGAPAYGAYTQAGMREAGDIFQQMAGTVHELKNYCQRNGAMAFVVNQPTSRMTSGPAQSGDRETEAFGGKANFFLKETLVTERVGFRQGQTLISIKSHKSRHMTPDHEFAKLAIENSKVVVQINEYAGRQEGLWGKHSFGIPHPGLGQQEKQLPPKHRRAQEPEPENDNDTGQTEDDSPDMEIPEDQKADAEADIKPEYSDLDALIADIKAAVAEKGLGRFAFRALMQGRNIAIEQPTDIKDVDTASQVLEALALYGTEGNDDDIPF